LLATQATPAGLASCPLARWVARCVALASEADRRRAHAAADLVVVPRASSAGLPVKLLDALARGVPAVAAHKAAGGLLLDAVCTLVDGDDPRAFAAAIPAARCARAHSWRARTERSRFSKSSPAACALEASPSGPLHAVLPSPS
jgi:glycosyltransferase involved in cell wall biosynthesis